MTEVLLPTEIITKSNSMENNDDKIPSKPGKIEFDSKFQLSIT